MSVDGGMTGLPADAGELHAAGMQRPATENFFTGPNGMRAGWRLLLFIFLMFVCLKAEGFTLKHIPGVDAWFKAQDPNVMTPATMIFAEGILLSSLVIATAVMALIEKRTYADYFLPLKQAFGRSKSVV